jgi:hypothetical protein
MIESVRHLTRQGFSLLCPCPSVPMPEAPAYRLFTMLRSMSDRCIRVYDVQGKVVTEENSFDATPVCTEPVENIGVGSPRSPSNLPTSALQFDHARSSVG